MSSQSAKDFSLSDFRKLYESYNTFVRKSLYWMLHKEAIDDVVQETFVKVWKSLHKFKGESQLQTWIYRIALNTAYDHMRKEKRHNTKKDTESEQKLIAISLNDEVNLEDKNIKQQALKTEI